MTFSRARRQYHGLSYQRSTTVDDIPLRGLENGGRYYVTVLDANTLRLSESEGEAKNAAPIDLDPSQATGSGHTLGTGETPGIGIQAELTSKETASAVAGIGGDPIFRDFLVRKELQMDLLAKLREKLVGKAKDKTPSTAGASTSNYGLAGAIAFTYSDHDVLAEAGAPAVLKSGLDVIITAKQKDKLQSNAESTISKENPTTGVFSAAVIVGLYDNNVQARIADGASVDAKRNLDVTAEVSYPFLTEPTFQALFLSKWDEQPLSNLGSILDKKLGLQGKLFNSWARSTAGGGGASTSISGSVDFVYITNVAKASIGASAKINQTAAYQTDAQKVTVSAKTQMQFVYLAGIFDLNISEQGFFTKMYKGRDPFGVLNPMGAKGKKGGVGGSFLILILDSDTEATIGSNALVRTGANGGLTLTAKTNLTSFALAQSGANAENFGVAGTFSYVGIDNVTLAKIAGGAQISGGAVTLTADDNTLHINLAGGVVKANNTGIGITISVNDIDRRTEAIIGDQNANATLNNIGGDVKVTANADGSLYAFSLAASILTKPPPWKPPWNKPAPNPTPSAPPAAPPPGTGLAKAEADCGDVSTRRGPLTAYIYRRGGDDGASKSTREGSMMPTSFRQARLPLVQRRRRNRMASPLRSVGTRSISPKPT